jgi:hypothetical protein
LQRSTAPEGPPPTATDSHSGLGQLIMKYGLVIGGGGVVASAAVLGVKVVGTGETTERSPTPSGSSVVQLPDGSQEWPVMPGGDPEAPIIDIRPLDKFKTISGGLEENPDLSDLKEAIKAALDVDSIPSDPKYTTPPRGLNPEQTIYFLAPDGDRVLITSFVPLDDEHGPTRLNIYSAAFEEKSVEPFMDNRIPGTVIYYDKRGDGKGEITTEDSTSGRLFAIVDADNPKYAIYIQLFNIDPSDPLSRISIGTAPEDGFDLAMNVAAEVIKYMKDGSVLIQVN